MPAITLGYSQIEQQIRVIRRRRNWLTVQHALYLCGGMVLNTLDEPTLPERLSAEAAQRQKATMHHSFEASNRFMNASPPVSYL